MNSYINFNAAKTGCRPLGLISMSRQASLRDTASTWLRYGWQLALGVVSGVVLTAVCTMTLGYFLYTWAIVIGPIVALAIWTVIIIGSAVHLMFRGWNSARIRFLAGCGIIPCYAGVSMIIYWSELSNP